MLAAMFKNVLCCIPLRRQCSKSRLLIIILVFVHVCVLVKIINSGESEENDEDITYDYKPKNPQLVSDLFDSRKFLLKSNLTFSAPNADSSPLNYVVVCIGTAVKNFIRRKAIRETFATQKQINNTEILYLFFVGKTSSVRRQKMLNKEAAQHNDIIQADFDDTYRNLTLKSMSMLLYVYENYINSTYVVKIDDDTFINLPLLVEKLERIEPKKNVLLGRLFKKVGPERDKTSRYYTSVDEYDLNEYPNYLSGSAYVMSSDVAIDIWDICQLEVFIPMEDVFITGFCSSYLFLRPEHDERFKNFRISTNACDYKKIICGHYVKAREMRKIWTDFRNVNFKC